MDIAVYAWGSGLGGLLNESVMRRDRLLSLRVCVVVVRELGVTLIYNCRLVFVVVQ